MCAAASQPEYAIWGKNNLSEILCCRDGVAAAAGPVIKAINKRILCERSAWPLCSVLNDVMLVAFSQPYVCVWQEQDMCGNKFEFIYSGP